LAAVDAVGEDGGGADDGSRARDRAADDASPGSSCSS
jgi:hypothetical protein